MDYTVSCIDEGVRVRATSKVFTYEAAQQYATTVAQSREPKVESICGYCGEWQKDDFGGHSWPACIGCGAV